MAVQTPLFDSDRTHANGDASPSPNVGAITPRTFPTVTATASPDHGSPVTDEEESVWLARAAAWADRWQERAARASDDDEAFPDEAFRELVAAGFLAAPLPAEHGGPGFGVGPGRMLGLLRLLKHVGRGHLVAGRVYEGHANALALITLFGTPDQREWFAAEARGDGRVFGVWNAEDPAEGVHVCPVVGRPGRWRLEGAKIFASGAARQVERPFVNGRLPDGSVQMCVVPMERVRTVTDPSWWQPLGMKGTDSFRVDFTGVELGPEHLVGGPGDYYRDPWFSAGAVRFAAVQLGGAEALHDACRRYLARLGRSHDPYQGVRAADSAALVEAGNLWLRGAAEAWERPAAEADNIVAYAGMMRTAVERICTEVIVHVQRSVGARGLMRPEPFERLVRDLTMYLRQPAPDASAARVARHVLADAPEVPAYAQWSGRKF